MDGLNIMIKGHDTLLSEDLSFCDGATFTDAMFTSALCNTSRTSEIAPGVSSFSNTSIHRPVGAKE